MFSSYFVLSLYIYGVLAAIEDFDEWQYDVGSPSINNGGGDSKCKKDLLLIVDTSISMEQTGFEDMTKFLKNFVADSRLNVGPEGTQIGLILFSNEEKTAVKLTMGQIQDPQQLVDYINKLELDWLDIMGKETRTDKALQLAMSEIFTQSSPSNFRSDVDDVIVLMTDGDPYAYYEPDQAVKDRAEKYARRLKSREIVLLTAGIGPESNKKTFEDFLKGLATSPDYSFKAMFSTLDEILGKLVSKSCIKPGSCTCDEIISDPFFVQPGKEQAMAQWLKPTFMCATGGKVAIESTVVDPDVTSPHAFAPGEHVITYTYNLKGGVKVSCPVKIIIKGPICRGKPYTSPRQICCCGAIHTRRSGFACCGPDYFDRYSKQCCADANLVSKSESCPY